MDIGLALKYIFDDERWIVKGLIGAVLLILSFLIVPALFVVGYVIRIVRNVMVGEEHPLPEWDNWGEMLGDGFNVTVAGLVYTLPIWLLSCCSFVFFAPAAISGGNMGDMAEIMAGLGVAATLVFGCLSLLILIALIFVSPAITIQYARTDSLAETLHFREVLEITRENLGDISVAVVVIFGISFVLGLIGVVPLIGWLIALAGGIYVSMVSGHLFGQIGAKAGFSPKEKAAYDNPI